MILGGMPASTVLRLSRWFWNHQADFVTIQKTEQKKNCCRLPYIGTYMINVAQFYWMGTKGVCGQLIRLLLRLPGDQADNLTKPRAKISFSNLTAKMTHMDDVCTWRLVLSLSFLTVDFLHFFECVYICAKEGKLSPLDLNFFHGTFFSDQLTRERNGSAGKSVNFNQDWEKDYREK